MKTLVLVVKALQQDISYDKFLEDNLVPCPRRILEELSVEGITSE